MMQLDKKLEALRALQALGKSVQEIIETRDIKQDNMQDKLISLIVENAALTSSSNEKSQEVDNPKSLSSVFKLLSVMAADGYGYNHLDKKSPIPNEITNAVTRVLGENIDPDTVRKWLKHASEKYPPIK